ncbi:MAG: hypothetical protein ACOY45_04600 [Pseudomonadota bacterium]
MTDTKASNGSGCIVAVVAILMLGIILASLGRCSLPADNKTKAFGVAELGNQIAAIDTPPPVKPLDARAAALGATHFKQVFAAEGLSGAMVYSQNCYDSVSRKFIWAKLDQCGAFDVAAAKAALLDTTPGLEGEQEYFGSEAGATRYLTTATKAGEDASEADLRLEALQKQVRQ